MKGNHFEEDRFFDDMDTENQYKLREAPAPAPALGGVGVGDSEGSVDPLDAFMMGVESEAKKDLIVSLEHTYGDPLNTNVWVFFLGGVRLRGKMRS
jgi:hypothetical protein